MRCAVFFGKDNSRAVIFLTHIMHEILAHNHTLVRTKAFSVLGRVCPSNVAIAILLWKAHHAFGIELFDGLCTVKPFCITIVRFRINSCVYNLGLIYFGRHRIWLE
jgi:hypothetical protein